ncbi:MAG: aminopeptidase P family protein [Alphaproteobacteria bacterium]|nr:aminopeptidase P family protein [Alphaproteobacteria bacterium]MBL7099221.1 aminopeptidase P family protein [Alphaproteobacteria bacterium]
MSAVNTPPPIALAERQQRLAGLRALMDDAGLAAVILGSTKSLRYFTGLVWGASERFTGAIVHADGRLDYVCPGFELTKVAGSIQVPGNEIVTWEEEESPYAFIASRLRSGTRVALDDQVALFVYLGLAKALGTDRLADAGLLINTLRRRKSVAEIALMQSAKDITLEVHRRTWKSLAKGVKTSEVTRFIDQQHRTLAGYGNTFCIVSFGSDSALPHGGEQDRALVEGDVVLIDTGTQIDGYQSDITRTYVFGEPTRQVREIWTLEKEAQAAAFEAARLGTPCESVDAAARAVITRAGLGPDYRLPGLPHRTGHGIGLDIHEPPNLVRGDRTVLAPGMCFSNEPMIVVPDTFGIRLEDHFHMTERGPRWFTQPSHSLEQPFAGVPEFV